MNEISPKVSIVLPTYNGASRIKQSIDSCLNQTYKNVELIIVDDGSFDETPRIIRSYKDPRIKYIRHKKNAGLPNALNTGFANADGNYLTWTSDDNQYLPTAIEEMVKFLEKNKAVDLVYADYWAHYLGTENKELRKMPDVLNLAIDNNVGACFLYTRRVYENVGNYDPKYRLVEDYEYWIRVSKKFRVAHYPRPLYIYGEHSKSLKSTRHSSILLLTTILRYENNYLSFPEFEKAFYESYSSIFGDKFSDAGSPKKILFYFQNILKISRISFRLCLLCFLLLFRMFVWAYAWTFFVKFMLYPLEYADFFFFFRLKSSQFKVTNGKKNILCIVPHIVPGGADQVIFNIAKVTNAEKFNFHIVTSSMTKNEWQDKFKKHFLNVITPMKRTKSIYYKYFQQLIKKLNIDIVLITNSTVGYEYLPQLKSEFTHVKTIDLLHAEGHPPIRIEQFAPYIDKRICISHRLKNYMIRKYQISGIDNKYIERLQVVHNGIDTREFNPNIQVKSKFKLRFSIPENVPVISFIGRFYSEKKPLLFVKIAKNVVARSPAELKFVMAGDGLEFNKVTAMIKNYGLEEHFVLTGMLDSVAELLKDTYILLVVSRNEGIPLVVLEAMSMGVPVISTDVGAISEVLERNGTNGFLIDVDENTVESFTSKILGLLQGKTNYCTLAEKARETISSKFTLQVMGKQYQSIFDELVEEQGNKKNLETSECQNAMGTSNKYQSG